VVRFPGVAGTSLCRFWDPPSSLLSKGTGGFFPGHEANLSPLSSEEFKNAWSYIFTPPYVFKAWYLVKHRDNFTSEPHVCLPRYLSLLWLLPRIMP